MYGMHTAVGSPRSIYVTARSIKYHNTKPSPDYTVVLYTFSPNPSLQNNTRNVATNVDLHGSSVYILPQSFTTKQR